MWDYHDHTEQHRHPLITAFHAAVCRRALRRASSASQPSWPFSWSSFVAAVMTIVTGERCFPVSFSSSVASLSSSVASFSSSWPVSTGVTVGRDVYGQAVRQMARRLYNINGGSVQQGCLSTYNNLQLLFSTKLQCAISSVHSICDIATVGRRGPLSPGEQRGVAQ